MLLLVFFLTALVGGTKAFTSSEADAYFNRLINDSYVEKVTKSGLDPAQMEDIIVNIKGRPDFKGVVYHEGILRGLSLLKSAGNCTPPVWQFVNITFQCSLCFDELSFTHNVTVLHENHETTALANATFVGVVVYYRPTADYYWGKNIPFLKQGFPRVEWKEAIYSLPTDNFFSKIQANRYKKYTREFLESLTEGPLVELFQENFSKTPFPYKIDLNSQAIKYQ